MNVGDNAHGRGPHQSIPRWKQPPPRSAYMSNVRINVSRVTTSSSLKSTLCSATIVKLSTYNVFIVYWQGQDV